MATVDSSVGGKTGVNHPLGKNMIGAFHQPQCVLIDTDTLTTLPDRELASGISEIVKYGLIRDAPLFEWPEQNMDRLMQRDPEVGLEPLHGLASVISKVVTYGLIRDAPLFEWLEQNRLMQRDPGKV